MMGEELTAAGITERGLLGDRAYALVDRSDGKVASAKNPRKWPQLFDFRAAFVDPPRAGTKVPPVRIALPDGTVVSSEQGNLNQILSRALNREVTLDAAERGHREVVESTFPNPWTPKAEEYWPDMEGLDYRDTVTDFNLPEGTFFDCAVVHLLTTATVDRLRELYPSGRFEVRRFRPNIVVETGSSVKDFVENAWIGRTLAIGGAVRLSVTGPCPRCVMTTLPKEICRRIRVSCAQRPNITTPTLASTPPWCGAVRPAVVMPLAWSSTSTLVGKLKTVQRKQPVVNQQPRHIQGGQSCQIR
jgi:uncharacterized protein